MLDECLYVDFFHESNHEVIIDGISFNTLTHSSQIVHNLFVVLLLDGVFDQTDRVANVAAI